MENLDPTLLPEMVRGGFILDSVQNCSCVRAMLFRNTVSVGWKLIRRLTAAWLAQLGEGRSAGGGGVMSTAREVGDKGRQAAVCRILALSFYEAGDYIQSLESSKEELAIAREVGDRERQASVCDVLARSYLCVGGYKQSIEYGKKALSIARYGIILRFWETAHLPLH